MKAAEFDPRVALRHAQEGVGRAEKTAQAAAQTAERARAVVARAEEALRAHGDIDADIARLRADAVRQGGSGAGPLPPELATRRQRQQRAQEELADAGRTRAMLEAEAVVASTAAATTRAEAVAAADAVMVSEAEAVAAKMRLADREAARLRMLLYGFLNSRASAAATLLPWSLASHIHDTHGPAMMDVAGREGIALAPGPWTKLRAALAADPDAKLDA